MQGVGQLWETDNGEPRKVKSECPGNKIDPCSRQLLPGLASNAVKPLDSEKVGLAKLL